ncbi:MAG: hypothetical protein WCO56_25660 [Verrucomicrobiota bacterium]
MKLHNEPQCLRKPFRPRKNVILLLALLGIYILLQGCSSEPVRHYNRLQVASYVGNLPGKAYGTVRFFQTPDEIKQPFEAIGLMTCEAPAGDEATVINAMLYRAADMRADAVLLNSKSNSNENVSVGLPAFLGSTDRVYRAQAIRLKAQAIR